MTILAQFLLRLAFGLAVGIAITSPRQVTSGFYRNHLFVTLGLATLAALVLWPLSGWAAWLAVAAAVLSYVGSVCWLYESRRPGVVILWLVAAGALAAALLAQEVTPSVQEELVLVESASLRGLQPSDVLGWVSVGTSGLVLGLTTAAMLLGHWYLNAPGMKLAPLRRLLLATSAAVGLQILVSGLGLWAELQVGVDTVPSWLMFVLLRWSFGLVGVLALVWMAWKTLEVPNTQSATGILYVAVIGVFVGELAALLLSAESVFPL